MAAQVVIVRAGFDEENTIGRVLSQASSEGAAGGTAADWERGGTGVHGQTGDMKKSIRGWRRRAQSRGEDEEKMREGREKEKAGQTDDEVKGLSDARLGVVGLAG